MGWQESSFYWVTFINKWLLINWFIAGRWICNNFVNWASCWSECSLVPASQVCHCDWPPGLKGTAAASTWGDAGGGRVLSLASGVTLQSNDNKRQKKSCPAASGEVKVLCTCCCDCVERRRYLDTVQTDSRGKISSPLRWLDDTSERGRFGFLIKHRTRRRK